ncbi:MAG: oxidative damage protection protein [Gammaproteobacteria bacterium]|nr:oxidative damage protection protein [Gammaproteobacteria bacterium]MCF6363945.1 oxidative damage protection protein [Gammaproteobacteria bacterium]
MSRMVECVVLKQQAEGLESVLHPGELGQRIYENVSQEGWQQWLQRLAMIINENGLSTADPASIEIIEGHMRGFFFGEGSMGGTPDGYQTPGSPK